MTFNYYDLKDDDPLHWLVLAVTSENRKSQKFDDDLFETLKGATNGFTEIDLTIEINGVRMDGAWLFPRFVEQFEAAVEREVKQRTLDKFDLADAKADIEKLQDAAYSLARLLDRHEDQ